MINQVVIKTLARLEGTFDKEKGELAYLTLTSKPEHMIRDRLAWALQEQLGSEFIVAREWKRIDMALLRNQNGSAYKSEALIQLKTWSLCTFIGDADDHFKKLYEDLEKCRAINSSCPAYALLLATSMGRVPDSQYDGVVKYRNGWEKVIKDCGSIENVKCKAKESITEVLKKFKLCAEMGEMEAGTAFDVKVSVLYWLIQEND